MIEPQPDPEVVKIKSDRPKGYRIISKDSFDPSKHSLFDAKPEPVKPRRIFEEHMIESVEAVDPQPSSGPRGGLKSFRGGKSK